MMFNRFLLCLYFLFYSVGIRAYSTLPFQQLHEVIDSKTYQQIGDESIENLPELFDHYENELGVFQKEDCDQAVTHVYYQSLVSKKVYELYYTSQDRCDGGNAYGLILGKKDKHASKDRVIGIIRDSYCEPHVKKETNH